MFYKNLHPIITCWFNRYSRSSFVWWNIFWLRIRLPRTVSCVWKFEWYRKVFGVRTNSGHMETTEGRTESCKCKLIRSDNKYTGGGVNDCKVFKQKFIELFVRDNVAETILRGVNVVFYLQNSVHSDQHPIFCFMESLKIYAIVKFSEISTVPDWLCRYYA